MRSPAVQEALQTEMWMYAAEPGAPKAEVMRHASEPATHYNPSAADIASKNSDWVNRWTKVVLK